MDNNTRGPRPPRRRVSVGAKVSLQDGEDTEVQTARDAHAAPDRPSSAAGRTERWCPLPHQRHMPREPLKFHIPRKTKEQRALFQYVSNESREYDDIINILTSSYMDAGSAGCFTYLKPRLTHSELLEKEFVEKRKEMKAEGRTDMEMEESYCFLFADTVKLPCLCEKGLLVGQSWMTVLGNPGKGVYLSRYSDLLQINPLTPGVTGDIIIFKVMKGKVKSIYENMKNLLDPTPRFDSHISKNASKVTSLTSYRAFELTQQYFYEYSFDELRQRPRHVCPYAVVSFHFKGKDSPLPSKPLTTIRLNSQNAEGSKGRAQFTVWTGDLVNGVHVLFQICLRSFSPPFLPHRLPEKLEIGRLMRLNQLTKHLPADLLSYNLYSSSQEVVKSGHCCSLLEVTDRSGSMSSLAKLLQELETKGVVLVTPLTDRGFLFLISSVQMATPSERGESWKRCLQALFVFPESRDVAKSTVRCASSSHEASESLMSGCPVMPKLRQFIPALHHALVKIRVSPPPELSAGVELMAREYLSGLKEGKVRQYPMGEYDSKLDEQEKLLSVPEYPLVNMDSYLLAYTYKPAIYQLSVARARLIMEEHGDPEEPQEARPRKSGGGQREAMGNEETGNAGDRHTNNKKMQQLIDLVLTCKRDAESEVRREEGRGGVKVSGRKRKLEQETAERTLLFLKASQEPGRHSRTQVEKRQASGSPGSLASVISSVDLKEVDLREDGSEPAAKLLRLLTDLSQAARGTANQSLNEVHEEGQRESFPFNRLAIKLGLPTNCDIDLRKQEELEEQTAGSISSLEGFSPGSHSGEMIHHGAAGRGGGGEEGGLQSKTGGYKEEEEEWEIPWVLVPITGLCSLKYTQRDRNIPQDPRFQHLAKATGITPATKASRKSPSRSPERSPPPSPMLQYPSPDPSPPASPSQCPSPEPSPPPTPSQCPSPEPSPPPSPSKCLSPLPRPSQCRDPRLIRLASPSRCQSMEHNELSTVNKDHSGAYEHSTPTNSREFSGVSTEREEKPQGTEKKNGEPSVAVFMQPPILPAPERTTNPSPLHTGREKGDAKGEMRKGKEEQAHAEGEKETKPPLNVQKRGKDQVKKEEEVVEISHVVTSDEEPKGKINKLVGGTLFSSSTSLPRSPLDSIIDKNLAAFSSEIQLLLQEQGAHHSFPHSPHCTSNTETTAAQHTLPHTQLSRLSRYVSFFTHCPPVEDYVSSLHDDMDKILTEFNVSWQGTSQTDVDAALASRVSDFVSSIRAGNANTGGDDDGEQTAAEDGASLSGGGEVWQPHTITVQVPNATNNRNPTTPHVTLSATTSAPGSVYKPANTSVLIPAPEKTPQSDWTHKTRQDNSITRTVHCTSSVEGGSSLTGTNCEGTLPGFSVDSKPSTEASHPSEPVSSPASASVPAPPSTALSSLISQLQPEVFSSLVEIIKDVKRNSLQFYLHSTEPGDQVHQDVKEYMLKQGNVEHSPVAFLNQENSDSRLLVIIKNKDIAGHIHKIPGLVSLKRQASVVFMGIDTLDDIRNNSYNDLFVSGGCILSDELVLNPDYVSHDRLAALMMLLEQNSSPESGWRWKVHCKTLKKLKEQARFRRDAADLLNLLLAFQKRHIVELLPYHQCDMVNHQSPHLDCLMELQARYTQYRHTVFVTERKLEKFSAYSSSGIIVAGIEEILQNFNGVFGYHDIKARQPIIDDMLGRKEHIRPLSSCDQPQHLLQQSGSILPAPSHLSDQLVPDSSFKESHQHHSDTDFEALRLAISQLRAKRQAQLQQQVDSEADLRINSRKRVLPSCTDSSHDTPLLAQGGPTGSVKVSHDRKLVAATHSAIEQEPPKKVRRKEEKAEAPTERGGGELMGGNRGPSNSDTSTPSSNQKAAAVTESSARRDVTNDGREKADQQGEAPFPRAATHVTASSRAPARPAEGYRSRDTRSGQEQQIRGKGAPPGNSAVSGTKTSTRRGDGPDHDNPRPSATTCSRAEVDFLQLCSTAPTCSDGKQVVRPQPGKAEDSSNLSMHSTTKRPMPRLQLYNYSGRKFHDSLLMDPMIWQDIAFARPGRIPNHLPYLRPDAPYRKLRAISRVVARGMAPQQGHDLQRLPCDVTCYQHEEGPWCEVQSPNGTTICVLATKH